MAELTLKYTPLNEAKRWADNPKKHDIDLLIKSIQKHGFQSPPKFDYTLDGIVAGNGRIAALLRMQETNTPPPKGIIVRDGEWLVPIVYGNDFPSVDQAIGYALDDNNITLLGGDFTDTTVMWDVEQYMALLQQAGDNCVSVSEVEMLMQASEEFAGEGGGGGQFLRFGEFKIPITDQELEALSQLANDYKAEHGDFEHFVTSLTSV